MGTIRVCVKMRHTRAIASRHRHLWCARNAPCFPRIGDSAWGSRSIEIGPLAISFDGLPRLIPAWLL